MEQTGIDIKDLKTSILQYIAESQALLKLLAVPDEKTVHDVRVLMKKSKAALRLASPHLDSKSVNRLKIAFQETGRNLCQMREAAIHKKILKRLRKKFPAIFSRLTENDKINTLIDDNELSEVQSRDDELISRKTCTLLRNTGFRLRFQSWRGLDQQMLREELENTYLKVRKVYLNCRNHSGAGNIHEFRKRAKDLHYQLYFFRAQNADLVKPLEKKLSSLTMYLGKYNDLTQLVKVLDYRISDSGNNPAMDQLIVKIREIQDSYLSEIWPLAYKIFFPAKVPESQPGLRLPM